MLSIIIPTLNEEKYLPRLLESIKKQNFKDYEIIVADAGSRDRTGEIAKQYGCKIVKGGLPAKGRNEGAKASRGEELLFLDADAILPRGFLEKFLKEIRKKNLDVVGCAFKIQEQGFIYRIGEYLWNFYFWITQKFFPHATNCIYVKRWLHDRVKGFDERIQFGEDCVYTRDAAKVGKFQFLSSPYFYVSARRVEKEGVLKFFFKYIFAEMKMLVLHKNILHSDSFEYRFDHYLKNHEKTNLPLLRGFHAN